MDEVRIYNRALSDAEIKSLYEEHVLVGDFDNDRDIDLADFSVISSDWQSMDGCDVDLTCDCVVNMDDLMMFIDHWLMNLSN
jgi:hypothetical protein